MVKSTASLDFDWIDCMFVLLLPVKAKSVTSLFIEEQLYNGATEVKGP